jgi:hypothetical protein
MGSLLVILTRRRADSNRRIKVLQTSPLPLGYGATISSQIKNPTAWWDGRRGSIFLFEEVHSILSIQDVVNAHCYFPVGRAGNGTRTRDINLGKVALYQLSYSRDRILRDIGFICSLRSSLYPYHPRHQSRPVGIALYQLSYSRKSLRLSLESPLTNTKGTGSSKYKKIPI